MTQKALKRRKRIGLLIGLLLVMLLLLSGLFFLRLRNGTVIRAGQTTDLWFVPADSVTTYRQDDAEWAEDRLGESVYTMKSSGCLVSCIASAVSMETGKPVTAGELNRIFSEHQVYDGEGNLQWKTLETVTGADEQGGDPQKRGYSAAVFQKVRRSDIDQCLKDGHFPIVRVRMHGLGNFHYVLIVGIWDGQYVCMDPLQDELTELSDYWNRVYAVRVVCAD